MPRCFAVNSTRESHPRTIHLRGNAAFLRPAPSDRPAYAIEAREYVVLTARVGCHLTRAAQRKHQWFPRVVTTGSESSAARMASLYRCAPVSLG